MSANADSVRFKFARKFHDWAYFEKLSVSEKHKFYIKLPMVLGRTFLVSNFLKSATSR